jgi:serine-protein kinase ATM
MPFGDFIEDRKQRAVSARSRYYPGEWSAKRCLVEMQKLYDEFKVGDNELGGEEIGPAEARRRKEKLRVAFDLICMNNSPVFRFFFVENFVQPEVWFAARVRYTRSVAVSSMVGHILGIGMRLLAR